MRNKVPDIATYCPKGDCVFIRKHLSAAGVQLAFAVFLAAGISHLGGSKASVGPVLIWILAGSAVVNACVPALLARYRRVGLLLADQVIILVAIEGTLLLASPYHSVGGDVFMILLVSMPLLLSAFAGYGVGVIIRGRRGPERDDREGI